MARSGSRRKHVGEHPCVRPQGRHGRSAPGCAPSGQTNWSAPTNLLTEATAMASNYKIKQGEHVSRIAKQFGFADYRTIWDHPNNAALKDLRKNPNVLAPGDQLFIPDKQLRKESRPTGATHRF